MGRRGQPDIRAVIARQLDADYIAATNATFAAIQRDNLAASVASLEERARQLQEQGARFTPDDPALIALRTDFDAALVRHQQRISDIALNVQELGVTEAQTLTLQKALLGIPDGLAGPIRAAWNNPDPAALARLVSYTSSPAFDASLARFGTGIAGMAQNVILGGVAAGWGPLRTARELRRVVQGLPIVYSNSLMRSLQLNSYRDATTLQTVANADILEGSIRIAALDLRTCAACIALHGTFLAVGERVDDHRNGRCDSVPIVKGRGRNIQTGPEWFDTLSPAEQTRLAPFRATPAKLNALNAGVVQWPDFVQQGVDPLFGEVVSEASLSGILGEGAKQFYVRQ